MCNGKCSINDGHGPKACKLAEREQGTRPDRIVIMPTTVWRWREILETSSTFRGFEHELGPLPGVAGFLALQQRAVLIDPDGREAVPGDAQRKGSFVLVA